MDGLLSNCTSSLDECIDYLVFLLNVRDLFHGAIGVYDFAIAAAIADRSKMDPKVLPLVLLAPLLALHCGCLLRLGAYRNIARCWRAWSPWRRPGGKSKPIAFWSAGRRRWIISLPLVATRPVTRYRTSDVREHARAHTYNTGTDARHCDPGGPEAYRRASPVCPGRGSLR